jgi:hypothetical protein
MAAELLANHGLRKGDNRVAFAPDGSLWVGQTDHGWAGDKGIQRISWTGKVPLDVKEMHLTKTGFQLTFTQPVEASTATNPENYKARHYYYEYHAAYGSPEFDAQEETPKSATLSDDRTKVTLEFGAIAAWRIYEFHLNGLKGDDGAAMANPLVAYTVNHLVGAKTPPPPPPGAGVKDETMPADTKAPPTPTPKPKAKSTNSESKATPTPTPAPAATPAATPGKSGKSGGKKSATPTPTPTPTPKKKS